jgi:hypothetical protein
MGTMGGSRGCIAGADSLAASVERPSAVKSYRAGAPTGARAVSANSPTAVKQWTLSREIESHQIQ